MVKSSKKGDENVGNTRAKALKSRFKKGLSTPLPLLALNHNFQPKNIGFKQLKNSKKIWKTSVVEIVQK